MWVELSEAVPPQGASNPRQAPLLVKIPYKEGSIIFTSFHNERQNDEKEIELLKYLVFAAVTARETQAVERTLVQGGFSSKKQNLLSASASTPSVTKTYRNKAKCDLKFVLSFADASATLRLDVTGPDGRTRSNSSRSGFTISVAGAVPGDWTYTVTAEKVPYENFPFSLTIGENKAGERGFVPANCGRRAVRRDGP